MLIVRRAMQGHREILSTMPALQTEGASDWKENILAGVSWQCLVW
jgi:hypothetical protein